MNEIPRSFRTTAMLAAQGLVRPGDLLMLERVAQRYAVAVTADMAALIDSADAGDPIARQFVPDARELSNHPRELADPISDQAKSPIKGIVHRYEDRVLLKIASVCPVYCRFCFRREMVGPQLGEALTQKDIAAALSYIAAHPEIREVILTGGDPFVLAAQRIASLTRALGGIGHLEILRWHTRVPVVEPGRVTGELIDAINASGKIAVVAIHANHPRELTPAARCAIARLVQSGIPLLSQTVLLRDVNDVAATLEELMRALVDLGVKPYYLHHGDLAPGTAHFRTTIAQGKTLMQTLHARLPEKAVPRYVLDIPGGHGKVDIEENVSTLAEGQHLVRDARGREHAYCDAV